MTGAGEGAGGGTKGVTELDESWCCGVWKALDCEGGVGVV